MTSRFFSVSALVALAALPAAAQDDRILVVGGAPIEGCKVVAFDVRNLRYTKGGNNDTISTDRVAKVELGKFKDVFARGLRDPDLMLTIAREQLEQKNLLMAQLGFLGAGQQFFDDDEAQKAVGALDELQKAIPEAGVLPDLYRLKFEYYMGLGTKGSASALAVAKKYAAEATGGAWPAGLAVEADFFQVLSERVNVKDYQSKLRGIVGKAGSSNSVVATRANVELAHSMRENKDAENAGKLYEEVLKRENVDVNSRAGAILGLAKIKLEQAAPTDKEACKSAMLMFLRVRLETKDAWPSLHADALYHAMLAADRWRGPEYTLVIARCRRVLNDNFPGSEWAQRAAGK
jgi:hypothetical protein